MENKDQEFNQEQNTPQRPPEYKNPEEPRRAQPPVYEPKPVEPPVYEKPEETEPEPPESPARDPYEVEKEWAGALGMNFDSERASVPPPVESREPEGNESDGQKDEKSSAPVYILPPGTQLPPLHSNGPMPPTYMVWAIVATVCCCLPAGIVAIIFSSQVSTRYYSRDYEGARRASERAEIWIIIAIVLGIIVNALYFPLALMFQR